MTPQQEIERGRLAAQVLENPMFVDALAAIDAEIIVQWKAAKTPQDREWLHTFSQAMRKLDSVLRTHMQTGELRRDELRRKQSIAERAVNYFKAA